MFLNVDLLLRWNERTHDVSPAPSLMEAYHLSERHISTSRFLCEMQFTSQRIRIDLSAADSLQPRLT